MKKIVTILVLIFSSILLVACNTANKNEKFTVLFYLYENSVSDIKSNIKVEKDTKIKKPNDPVRPGSTFAGWFSDVLTTKAWDFEKDTVKENMVLYAKFNAIEYKITYTLNGGTYEHPDKVVTKYLSGVDNVILPVVKKTGRIFRGWFETPFVDEETSILPGAKGITEIKKTDLGDKEFHAYFEALEVNVEFITKLPDGRKVDAPTIVKIKNGQKVNFVSLDDPKGKYYFNGWSTLPDGEGKIYSTNEIFEEEQQNVKLYAVWEQF